MTVNYIYIAVLTLLSGVLAFLWENVKGDGRELVKCLRTLFLIAFLTTFAYVGFFASPTIKLAEFMNGVYFIGTDWLIFFLMIFHENYTAGVKRIPGVYYTYLTLLILDMVNLLSNPWLHHAFEMKRVAFKGMGTNYIISEYHFFFFLHVTFVYLCAMVVWLIFLNRTVHSTKFYKIRYMYITISFGIVLLVNGICTLINLPFDLSVICYPVLAVLFAYFSLYYVPRGIIEQSLGLVVQKMDSAIIIFDLQDNFLYANELAKKYLKYQKITLDNVEMKILDWKKRHNMEVNRPVKWEEEGVINGEIRSFFVEFGPVYDNDMNIIGSQFIFYDRTEDYRKLEEEHYKATHDELTGVYNRETFLEKVETFVRARSEEPYLMIVSDIRDFKLINDLFGTGRGDEVLKIQAEWIRKLSMPGSIYGRLEADRFALCMPKNRFEEIYFIEHIQSMKRLFEGSSYHMLIHCGVAEINDVNESAASYCDKAVMAIDEMENDYEKVFAYYDNNMLKRTLAEKQAVSEFERAMENDEFIIYLQPQVDRTGKMVSAEALTRWNHPKKGIIMPDEYVSGFEKSGLIHRLDLRIWEKTIRCLKKWERLGINDISVSINISPKDFLYIDVFREIVSLVDMYSLDAKKLNLEITESVFSSEVHRNLKLMDRFRDYGFTVELDDFGSGFSSLNLLKNMKVDVLKLDRVFLEETKDKERSEAILDMIIKLSKKLGIQVVCEGVETKEQLDGLIEMGCEKFQGYYFSKPISVEEFERTYLNIGEQ
ncbi:MAG: EAL domain-containing protein [Lachnospiraceae bacterium]|nr:EAL domain-containing protein [Lachnospiraceae bacterium]